MPLYSYQCKTCGHDLDAFNRIADRHTNAPKCPTCTAPMGIQLQPNIGFVQRDCSYMCPVTRQPVTSNRQRARIMAEHGLTDANDFKPKPLMDKAQREWADRERLAQTLKNPLPEKEMRKLLPRLPGH
jgi:putative FmdB family regulatory protein